LAVKPLRKVAAWSRISGFPSMPIRGRNWILVLTAPLPCEDIEALEGNAQFQKKRDGLGCGLRSKEDH